MTWSRFDDAAPSHPKARVAGNEAWALWCAAVMYCNRYLTDGFIPTAALAAECLPAPISITKAKKLAELLVNARLRPDGAGLFEHAEGGYVVHDFLAWNPSKSEVESKRKLDRDRKKSVRESTEIPRGIPDGIRTDSKADTERIPNRIPPARARGGAHSQPAQPFPSVPSPAASESAAPQQQEKPRNLSGALELAVCPRAEFVTREPYSAQWLEPAKWPEVERVAKAFASATGRPGDARLGSYQADAGLRAIVERFAEGWAPSDLETAARALPGTELAQSAEREGRRLGLSSLTPEVLRRMDPIEARPVSALVAKLAKDINLEREQREAGGVK